MEPVFDRYIALGDSKITGQARLARQQIIVVLIQLIGFEVVADKEGIGLLVIQRAEIHRKSTGIGSCRALFETIVQLPSSRLALIQRRSHSAKPILTLLINRRQLRKGTACALNTSGYSRQRCISLRQRIQQHQ